MTIQEILDPNIKYLNDLDNSISSIDIKTIIIFRRVRKTPMLPTIKRIKDKKS